jgi:hypothetical protein
VFWKEAKMHLSSCGTGNKKNYIFLGFDQKALARF